MQQLPADVIRMISKKVINNVNWTDAERAFGLQSLASLSHHWNSVVAGLSPLDFPYRSK